jgi:hypothetical protein
MVGSVLGDMKRLPVVEVWEIERVSEVWRRLSAWVHGVVIEGCGDRARWIPAAPIRSSPAHWPVGMVATEHVELPVLDALTPVGELPVDTPILVRRGSVILGVFLPA